VLGPGHAVDITLSAGRATGPVFDRGAGRYERSFAATAPRGTVATAEATVDGVALSAQPKVWFVVDRSEIGQPFAVRGGCDQSARPLRSGALSAPLVLVVLVLGFAVVGRRRRRHAPS
jgi:uncharacterized protein (TIGR03382 family)